VHGAVGAACIPAAVGGEQHVNDPSGSGLQGMRKSKANRASHRVSQTSSKDRKIGEAK
jgi:hypothetical protein